MVIKKCNNKGEVQIDWTKSSIVIGLLSTAVFFALKLSIESNITSRENKVAIERVACDVNRIDRNVETLVNLNMQRAKK